MLVFLSALYLAGGTSAFSLSEGPDDLTRKYSTCKVADTASICKSCAEVDEISTIMVILTFILSFLSMVYSIYVLFVDQTENSNGFQGLALLKKLLKLTFAIIALTSFKGCYNGMGESDDIIEVQSYKYGIGVICLIMTVLLTAMAGIMGLIVMYLNNKSDAAVGAAELRDLKAHPPVHHSHSHTHTHTPSAEQQRADNLAEFGQLEQEHFHGEVELDCNHKGHSHGFKHHANTPGAHHTGNQSGHHP